MNPPATVLSGTVDREVVGLRTQAALEVPLTAVNDLRQQLRTLGGEPFPASFLKASDEQTVVALAAVLQACTSPVLAAEDFTDWAVIAAPRHLGRLQAADVLHKFDPQTQWRVSPLFVPHTSLHAISGTVSMALQIHGRNFGTGGHRDFVVQGLLTTLSALQEPEVKGAWLVCTRCHPEPEPGVQGNNCSPSTCQALALALTPVAAGYEGLRLRLATPADAPELRAQVDTTEDCFTPLFRFLQAHPETRIAPWVCSLGWGGRLLVVEHEQRQRLTKVA